MKNNRNLFVNPSLESSKWDSKFIKLFNSGKAEELFDFILESNVNKLYIREYRILYCISQFTKQNISNEEIIESLKNYVKSIEIVQDEKSNSSEIIIKTEQDEIKVNILSKSLPMIEGIEKAETDERLGKCIKKSYEISKKLGIDNKIVTGYIYGMSDKAKYLHSWIETKLNGEEVVIDYTINAIISKRAYYKLQHAEPLSKISNKDVLNDEKYLKKAKINGREEGRITLEEYLVFRDEIIKDLQRNDKILLDESR